MILHCPHLLPLLTPVISQLYNLRGKRLEATTSKNGGTAHPVCPALPCPLPWFALMINVCNPSLDGGRRTPMCLKVGTPWLPEPFSLDCFSYHNRRLPLQGMGGVKLPLAWTGQQTLSAPFPPTSSSDNPSPEISPWKHIWDLCQ